MLVFGLATFNTGFLVAGLVLTSYWYGVLAGNLGGLGTLRGSALFVALWLASWWGTGRALRGMPILAPGRPLPMFDMLSKAFTWGGAVGVLFLFGIIVPPALFLGGVPGILGLLSVSLLFGFAAIFAFAVGGCVGLVCCLVDLPVLGLSRLAVAGGRDLRCDHAATA